MSFSFIDIEEKKSRLIALIFFSLIFFYLLTAFLVVVVIENSVLFSYEDGKGIFFLPSLEHILIALLIAFFAGILHWSVSTNNLVEKMTLAVGAVPIDQNDTYHQYFKNIVDEVSVATGGKKIEAMVIPSSGTNAFSLKGFEGRAVIGVTEGLLARLSRPQIEAVVAHEAGHIVSGDSLVASVTGSLAELYESSVARLRESLRRSRGRGEGGRILLFIVMSVTGFLSKLMRFFLSRQREYRADSIAVRLTRNPLSLAQALKMISGHWRGSGASEEKLESIFIVSPRLHGLDEKEGLLPDLFSTHPPIKKRINILLQMAHLDEKTLEENLKNYIRVSPVAVSELDFSGPTNAGECPHCKVLLNELIYEGVPVLKCNNCLGILADQDKVSRILIRQDKKYSSETERLAKSILSEKDKFRLKQRDAKSAWVIKCPKCTRPMRRQFFVYSYPVEIDRCIYCPSAWFDKEELELLQYIYENKEKYLF